MSAEFERIVLEKLDRIEAKLEAHDKKFEEHDRRFEAIDKQFEVVNKQFGAITDTLQVHQNLLTLFEYDFNQKMQAVLDGIAAINGRNAKYDDMFMHFSSKLLNHDVRISALEEEKEKYTK